MNETNVNNNSAKVSNIASQLGGNLLVKSVADPYLWLYSENGIFIGPTSLSLIDALNKLAGYIIYPTLNAYL